jgi:RNA polymerase sigma-70 factor (ECF subfamily)
VRDHEGRYPLLADEDLISLAGEGDAQAFAVLYDRHSRAVYSLAYRMTNGRQAAEDLAQDAFLEVWRAATSYRADRGGVRTWILSIVHNRGIDQLRSSASRRRVQDRVEATTDRWQPSEAFAESWRNSQREQAREALDTVPPEQLKILLRVHAHGDRREPRRAARHGEGADAARPEEAPGPLRSPGVDTMPSTGLVWLNCEPHSSVVALGLTLALRKIRAQVHTGLSRPKTAPSSVIFCAQDADGASEATR